MTGIGAEIHELYPYRKMENQGFFCIAAPSQRRRSHYGTKTRSQAHKQNRDFQEGTAILCDADSWRDFHAALFVPSDVRIDHGLSELYAPAQLFRLSLGWIKKFPGYDGAAHVLGCGRQYPVDRKSVV